MTRGITSALCQLVLCAAPASIVLGLASVPIRAQDTTTLVQTGARAQAVDEFGAGWMEQLVAPIALYPDPLLTQMLMASIYPLEVVEAARWSRDHLEVKGRALKEAMQVQTWHPSVKALTALPQILQMMSDEPDWVRQLGDAFLAQQQDLLDAAQRLRVRAEAAGHLQSNSQQRVTTTLPPADIVPSGTQRVIVIEPVDPGVYFVPIYDPGIVYGRWSYPAYPPFYWSPAGFVPSNVVSFTTGVVVGSAIWGGCDWWRHSVVIDVNRSAVFNWTGLRSADSSRTYDPASRGGVTGIAYDNLLNAAKARLMRLLKDGFPMERHPVSNMLETADLAAEGIGQRLRARGELPIV